MGSLRAQLVGLGVVVVLVVAFVVVASAVVRDARPTPQLSAGPSGSSTSPADHGQQTTSPPVGVPEDARSAIVERIVDGDTLRVVIADRGSERVRLLNIDTPELARDGRPAECLAVEATDRLAALVAPGDLVWLAGDVQDRDRYDRLLRGLWTVDGVFVNELLVAEGLAEVLLIAPNDRFHARIAEAEGAARADRRGLWGAACG